MSHIAANYRRMKMSDHDQIIPRALLRAMLGLVLVVLGLVTYAVLSERQHVAQTFTAPVEESRLIRINEGAQRTATVHAMDGTLLAQSAQGASGFIAVVQNSLSFERKRHGVTGNPPVTLVRFADGRLGLRDEATGWKIHLTGFGQDNTRAWAAVLDR